MLNWLLVLCVALPAVLGAEVKVLAFAGSTREDSVTKKLVIEAASIAQKMGASVTVVDLKDYPIPLYDGDLEGKLGIPTQAQKLRQLMIQSQVILISSPEYNGSLSAVLKNVIDWASRNEEGVPSRDAFKGKKFAIMSASPGPGGGARGLEHLRIILENVGGTVIANQVIVPDAYTAFDEQGHLKNTNVQELLQQQIQAVLQ